jgi:putative tryptophan/tyrosine transport system substrate-binding protein
MHITTGRVHGAQRHAGGRRAEPSRGLCTVGLLMTVALGVLVVSLAAAAPSAGKVYRIGYLALGLSPTPSAPYQGLEAFRLALRDLGYVEGQNLRIEYRWGELKSDTLPALATELVSLQVDLIVVPDTPAARAAKNATQTIPIVVKIFDPVGSGLVASLSRPDGNVTGMSVMETDLWPKRLELLREAVPSASHVAAVHPPSNPAAPSLPGLGSLTFFLRETEAAAKALGVQLTSVELGREPRGWDHSFQAMVKDEIAALFVHQNPVFFANRAYLAELAARHRLPTMYQAREYVEAGGLMAYGPNIEDADRCVATYVDKILKGAKPADLPVEQPTTFELVINLKTAQTLGLTIPPSLLFQADEVIK